MTEFGRAEIDDLTATIDQIRVLLDEVEAVQRTEPFKAQGGVPIAPVVATASVRRILDD